MNLLDIVIPPGFQVSYTPSGAVHPTEFGFITKLHTAKQMAFCRFWRADLSGLRTTTCSEAVDLKFLRPYESVAPEKVAEALEYIRKSGGSRVWPD